MAVSSRQKDQSKRKHDHLLFCTYRVDFEKAGLGKQLAEDKDDDTASVISEL